MTLRLQILLVLFTCLTLYLVIHNVHKGAMKIQYSIVWTSGVFGLLLVALFPDVLDMISALAGIEKTVNAVYLIVIFMIMVLVFYLYSVISKQSEQIMRLTYKVAELEKKMIEGKEEDK